MKKNWLILFIGIIFILVGQIPRVSNGGDKPGWKIENYRIISLCWKKVVTL